jgi:hypothetical protein
MMVAYLLTFNCYGTHMRGAVTGSVDRVRGKRGGAIEASASLVHYGTHAMADVQAGLNLSECFVVLDAIQDTCAYRNWRLLAAHVRSSHAHVIVEGIAAASDALRDLKAYASRALNRSGRRRHWARGGNVCPLPNAKAVRAAVRYVADGQGAAMAVYVAADL